MSDLCRLLWRALVGRFRSRAALEAENLVLRQQVNVLRRTAPRKPVFSSIDRLIFVALYRLFPNVGEALAIIKPETVVRWHRAGFRAYWRWQSRPRRGRPKVPLEIRQLIRDMSLANPLCGRRWGPSADHWKPAHTQIVFDYSSLESRFNRMSKRARSSCVNEHRPRHDV